MAKKKWLFVKANIGELLSLNGETLTTPTKIHAFKEADTENYVYGWQGDVAGNFHFFNKDSYNLTPKKTINGMLTFTASLTDTVYNAEKLTTTDYAYDAATGEFRWDSLVAEDISDVPTDIDLKTGKAKTSTDTGSGSGSTTTPKTANAALASLPTWAWFLIIPVLLYLGYLLIMSLTKKKKKVVSK